MAGCALVASGLADEEAIELAVAGPFGGVQPGHVAAGAGQVAGRQVAPNRRFEFLSIRFPVARHGCV